jgi:hypothetical protein
MFLTKFFSFSWKMIYVLYVFMQILIHGSAYLNTHYYIKFILLIFCYHQNSRCIVQLHFIPTFCALRWCNWIDFQWIARCKWNAIKHDKYYLLFLLLYLNFEISASLSPFKHIQFFLTTVIPQFLTKDPTTYSHHLHGFSITIIFCVLEKIFQR